MGDGKLISIDHSAAMQNAEDIARIAEDIASVRKKLQERAREGIPASFVAKAGKAGKETAPVNITHKIDAELKELDSLVEHLYEVAEKMRQISQTLAMNNASSTS